MRSGYLRSVGAEIEMDEEFVGNIATLPDCPRTTQLGWCRVSVGTSGYKAVKAPVNYIPSWGSSDPMPTRTKVALAGAALLAAYLITR